MEEYISYARIFLDLINETISSNERVVIEITPQDASDAQCKFSSLKYFFSSHKLKFLWFSQIQKLLTLGGPGGGANRNPSGGPLETWRGQGPP